MNRRAACGGARANPLLVVVHEIFPFTCCPPCDVLTLHFVEGEVHIYGRARDRRRLAARLAELVAHLVENPSEVARIAVRMPADAGRPA